MAGPLREISDLSSSENQAKECGVLEDELRSLKVAYEQYFLGMERQPPTLRHDAFKARLMRLRSGILKQTAVKFRVASLQTTATSYDRLWTRTMQEMENGTYRRDLFKARLHAKQRNKGAGQAAPAPSSSAPAVAASPAQAQAQAQAARAPAAAAAGAAGKAPQAGGTAAPRPSSPAAEGGLADAKLRSVYEAYVSAKKKCNEDVSKLNYETVAASLRKQVPALLKQHKAKEVEFQVVIKEGKAVLKALPK